MDSKTMYVRRAEIDVRIQETKVREAKAEMDEGYRKAKAEFDREYAKLKAAYEREVLELEKARVEVEYAKAKKERGFDENVED